MTRLKNMKKILICLFSFLFIGCSIAGGTVLLSNSYISDNIRGGESSSPENEIEKNAPTNTDFWTDAGNYADSFAGGTGSSSNPYQIATAEQLARLAYLFNISSSYSSFESDYFVQTADIDLSAHYWDPIGVYSISTGARAFSGRFNGDGFVISGLFTMPGNTEEFSGQGLFGSTYGRAGAYVRIENVTIEDSLVQGFSYIGGVVGGVISIIQI